jgi:MFS transporter, ACS family, glucarate transporter
MSIRAVCLKESSMSSIAARPTRVRHIILWLTVLLYMVTYFDRVLIATAMPTIQKEFGFGIETVGLILGAFQLSYALFQVPGGWMGDLIGPRRMLTAIVLWWSAFTAFTAMAWSVNSMIVMRFLFGMGEAGAFPNATRSLSRWMLPAERGWAQGVTHAGARLGAALTPVMVAFMIWHFGWRFPFYFFGVVGVVWAGVWYWYYRDTPSEHKGANEAERELIQNALGAAPKRKGIPWGIILSSPQMWALSATYFCYGYAIQMFLTWFPKYLEAARGMTLTQMGIFASLPLAAGVLGDLAGGWFSDEIIKKTGRIKFARKVVAVTGFFIAAIVCPFAVMEPDPYISAALFCIAVFALELVVGNAWAVSLDVGGNYAGSVSSVMNTLGNIGGFIMATATGFIVASYGWNMAFYVVAGLSLVGGLLFLFVDASKQIYTEPPTTPVV